MGSEEWRLGNPCLDKEKAAQIKDVGYPMNTEEVLAKACSSDRQSLTRKEAGTWLS